MAKKKQTVSEVQLKARKTSLGKKSVDELITIILRKDKSERKINRKIQELTASLEKAVSLNENKDTVIEHTEEIVKVKQEQLDNFVSKNNELTREVEEWSKKYVAVKNMANIRRKVIYTCFGVIAILIILLCYYV